MAGPRTDVSPARWLAAAGLALIVAAPAGAQGRSSGPRRTAPRNYAGAAARAYGQLGGTAVPYPGSLTPPAVTGSYVVNPGYYPNCYPYNPGYAPYPAYGGFGIGYPGFYAGANVGGFGLSVGLPATQQVVIDRRVYVLPAPGADSNGGHRESDGGGSRGSGQLQPQPAPKGDSGAARADNFYLARPGAAEDLREALKDMRRAWLNGDYLRLKDRFGGVTEVRLFPKGKYAATMSADEFAKMTRDALQAIETSTFEFEPPTMSAPNRAFVTGKHTFTAPSPEGGAKRPAAVFISYTLELKDGLWRVTEAGSGSEPITAHGG